MAKDWQLAEAIAYFNDAIRKAGGSRSAVPLSMAQERQEDGTMLWWASVHLKNDLFDISYEAEELNLSQTIRGLARQIFAKHTSLDDLTCLPDMSEDETLNTEPSASWKLSAGQLPAWPDLTVQQTSSPGTATEFASSSARPGSHEQAHITRTWNNFNR